MSGAPGPRARSPVATARGPHRHPGVRGGLGRLLRELRDSIKRIVDIARDLRLFASPPTPDEGRRTVVDVSRTVESALTQARGFTDQMSAVVANTRARVAETKQRVDTWVRRAAFVITALGVLGASGQFFAARFCWRVLRRKPA